VAARAAARSRKAKEAAVAETPRGYASPACLMHEVDPAYFGLDRETERAPKPRTPSSKRGKGKRR
jgi:hypothetical protein